MLRNLAASQSSHPGATLIIRLSREVARAFLLAKGTQSLGTDGLPRGRDVQSPEGTSPGLAVSAVNEVNTSQMGQESPHDLDQLNLEATGNHVSVAWFTQCLMSFDGLLVVSRMNN